MTCELWNAPDIELYFYGELDDLAHARVAAHLRTCPACRQRLDDLGAIRRALASRPVVDSPTAGDWSRFMRRLDAAVGVWTPARLPAVPERTGSAWRVRQLAALAAMLAIAALGVGIASRVRKVPAAPPRASLAVPPSPAPAAAPPAAVAATLTPDAALREVSAQHLERSKLVVLGLAARDPRHTQPSDWEYERTLAGTLLPETRLYRLAAQERGATDVAHVMRDLETVLLEASMSDSTDHESLERVQRLIARRGLVTQMQMVATSAGL